MSCNYKQCFHSKEDVESIESVIVDRNITNIDFNIITGAVKFRFHSEPHIVIRLWNKVRTGYKDIIKPNTQNSMISTNGSTIHIFSESPAFNFHSCQHTRVQILIPRDYPQAISLSGKINTGYFSLRSDSGISLENVDVEIKAGYMKIKNLNVKGLQLSAEVGYIKMYNSIATDYMKLLVNTGLINTHSIITNNLESIVKFGLNRHNNVTSDKLNVETEWGHSMISDVAALGSESEVVVRTEYGKSFLMMNDPNNLNFTLETRRGYLVVEYENEVWDCSVGNHDETFLSGSCSILEGKQETEESSVTVSVITTYGSSEIIVDRVDEMED